VPETPSSVQLVVQPAFSNADSRRAVWWSLVLTRTECVVHAAFMWRTSTTRKPLILLSY